jgi:hypothetical protein
MRSILRTIIVPSRLWPTVYPHPLKRAKNNRASTTFAIVSFYSCTKVDLFVCVCRIYPVSTSYMSRIYPAYILDISGLYAAYIREIPAFAMPIPILGRAVDRDHLNIKTQPLWQDKSQALVSQVLFTTFLPAKEGTWIPSSSAPKEGLQKR